MLHRVAISLAAAAFASAAPGPPRDLLGEADRARALQLATTQTVAVRRERPPAGRVWVPGGDRLVGAGWLVEDARVVTVTVLVEGWPSVDRDALEVRGDDGRWRPAAVGLADHERGFVVLDVPGLKAPGRQEGPGEAAVVPGRPLYGVVDGRPVLWRHVVGARGVGPFQYYWWVHGVAPPGTPLFGVDGRVATLVALPAHHEPGKVLALPEDALKDLFERSEAWRRRRPQTTTPPSAP